MREDKKGLSRNVCSVQSSRRREYNVWRRSKSLKVRAQMFRISAKVEFVEEVYEYYCLTKDIGFLLKNIDAIEKNCAYIERFVRPDGLLDSHVYYEDQVIKDGSVLQAQMFAVNAFRLMAQIEKLLAREKKSAYYTDIARRLADSAAQDFPVGFWNPEKTVLIFD